MTARHVEEGLERIARQEALIARMEALGGCAAFVSSALRQLADMRFQDMVEAHHAIEKANAALGHRH